MGYKLRREVDRHAPDCLTWRELHVLGLLADEANDATRLLFPGYEGDSQRSREFQHLMRRLSRSQYYAVLKALVDKGVLRVVERGRNNVQATYQILLPVAGELSGDAEVMGPGNQDPSATEADAGRVPENVTQEPGDGSAEPGPMEDAKGPSSACEGSRFGVRRVPETGTPTPHIPSYPLTGAAPAPDPSGPMTPQAPSSNEQPQLPSDAPISDPSPELGPPPRARNTRRDRRPSALKPPVQPGFLLPFAGNPDSPQQKRARSGPVRKKRRRTA